MKYGTMEILAEVMAKIPNWLRPFLFVGVVSVAIALVWYPLDKRVRTAVDAAFDFENDFYDEWHFQPYYLKVRLDLVVDGEFVRFDRVVSCRMTMVGEKHARYMVPVRQRTMSVKTKSGATVIAMAPYCKTRPSTAEPWPHADDYRTLVIYVPKDKSSFDYYLHPAAYDAPAANIRWVGFSIEIDHDAKPSPIDPLYWVRSVEQGDAVHERHGHNVYAAFGYEDVSEHFSPCPLVDGKPTRNDWKHSDFHMEIDSSKKDFVMLNRPGYYFGRKAENYAAKRFVPAKCEYVRENEVNCGPPNFQKKSIVTFFPIQVRIGKERKINYEDKRLGAGKWFFIAQNGACLVSNSAETTTSSLNAKELP
jgi:hypothetical protein